MVGHSWLWKSDTRVRFLLLFSDVNASPMLLEIVKNLKESQDTFRIVVIGDLDLEICKNLEALGIAFSIVSKRSKYGFVRMLSSVMRVILASKPETILASGQYATILGMVSAYVGRVPQRIFIRHHSNFHTKYGMHLGVLADRLANFLSTRIVAVSEVVKDILISSEDVNFFKVVLIHNGIDIQKFGEIHLGHQRIFSGESEIIRVGVVSRLTGWKGVQYSVDAFIKFNTQFPNSHLHIVGAPADSLGVVSEKLSALSKSDYTLTSWHPDVLGFLQELDIFIHVPIGPQDEAFGLVYIEALASRTPSIFTISGVLHELPSPEKYAYIAPYEDSIAILNEMINILDSTAPEKEPLPQKWLQQYSLDTMGKEYMKLLIGAKCNEY
jgi:glycosyltransferase involved in cell wall biosynthesis